MIYFDFSTQNKMIPDSDNPKISHLSPSLMHFHLKSKEWVSLWKSYTLKKNITVCLLAYQNFRVVNIGRKKVRQEESSPGRKSSGNKISFRQMDFIYLWISTWTQNGVTQARLLPPSKSYRESRYVRLWASLSSSFSSTLSVPVYINKGSRKKRSFFSGPASIKVLIS